MVKYPSLTEKQQHDLPALTEPARSLPQQFEDSTHQLWQCETVDGPMMLKICNRASIEQSGFWQGMNALFAMDFPASLGVSEHVHRYLAASSPLTIPEHIASESSAFVLATRLAGEELDAAAVTDNMVRQLARHLSKLHQQRQSSWGPLHQPELSAREWSKRLSQTLKKLAELSPIAIPENIFQEALLQAADIEEDSFVPIMPDLRWDQFLHQQGDLSALVDLDAFVVGPRELELVLLEYLLDEHQFTLFVEQYQQSHDIPDLSRVRMAYRLLLFLMNVLGEMHLQSWMQHPARF